MMECSIDGCGGAVACRTWCWKHYGRWQRMGDPLASKRELGIPARGWIAPLDRVLQNARHVAGPLDTECWVREQCLTIDGYTLIRVERRQVLAHRFVYEQKVGPIPPGLDLDHLCRVRNCVNPDHLEPVTRRENMLRGMSPAAVSYRANTCKYGHSMTNAYVYPYGRSCRTCRGIRNRGEKPTHI